MSAIKCRAKVSDECYDGKDEFDVYDSEGPGQSEDGTWDGRSVVCDSCYIALGTPNNAELPALIAAHRRPTSEEYTEVHESRSELEQAKLDDEASEEDGE